MKASRNVLAALSVLGAAGVVFVVLLFGRGSSAKNEALESRRTAMRRLGEHIRSERPGVNVLVLGNPFVKRQGASAEIRRYQRVGVDGLIAGLEGSAEVEVVFPELSSRYLERPESVVIPPTSRTPLSFVVDPLSVDALVESHPDRGVVVSLIGLPAGVGQLRSWASENETSFALLAPDLRLVGAPRTVAAAFLKEKILAAVIEAPDSREPLLVTKSNVETVLRETPEALGF